MQLGEPQSNMTGVLVTKATHAEGHVTRQDAISVLQLQVKKAKGAEGRPGRILQHLLPDFWPPEFLRQCMVTTALETDTNA